MMFEFGSYGVLQEGGRAESPQDRIAEEVSVRGFSVLPGVLDDEVVDDLCQRLDRAYVLQCEEVGGEDALLELQDADIVRCPLAYDSAFLALAHHPAITNNVKRLLGDNVVLLMQNGIINRPGRIQAQTRWHRDLNYQHWVSSSPLAVSAIVCLEDFTHATGGTAFLPASHKFAQFPSSIVVQQSELTVEAPRGSVVIFDSMVFHRAGLNSSNRIRRGINHVIGRPILAQQVDIPAMLNRSPPEDPWLAAYLGYRWKPLSDVRAWRLRKLERLRSGSGDSVA